jgi:hypothetical protein
VDSFGRKDWKFRLQEASRGGKRLIGSKKESNFLGAFSPFAVSLKRCHRLTASMEAGSLKK